MMSRRTRRVAPMPNDSEPDRAGLNENRENRGRRSADEELAVMRERYRQLFETMPIPLWVYDVGRKRDRRDVLRSCERKAGEQWPLVSAVVVARAVEDARFRRREMRRDVRKHHRGTPAMFEGQQGLDRQIEKATPPGQPTEEGETS